MRGLLAGTAVVLFVAAGSSGQPPEAGSITGTVRLTAHVRGTALPSHAYQPRSVGRHQPAATPDIRNVVVHLKNIADRGTPAAARHVFSLSGAATFDLGRYPKGQSKAHTFNKAGLVKIYCHIHSHMSASILVLDHPYYAVPNLDGTFVLRDVPAGRHTIVGWHERAGERTATIDVQPRKASSIDLSLPVEDQP